MLSRMIQTIIASIILASLVTACSSGPIVAPECGGLDIVLEVDGSFTVHVRAVKTDDLEGYRFQVTDLNTVVMSSEEKTSEDYTTWSFSGLAPGEYDVRVILFTEEGDAPDVTDSCAGSILVT